MDPRKCMIGVQRGSIGCTLACCKAGPSSFPGSAPQVGKQAMKKQECMKLLWIMIMIVWKGQNK